MIVIIPLSLLLCLLFLGLTIGPRRRAGRDQFGGINCSAPYHVGPRSYNRLQLSEPRPKAQRLYVLHMGLRMFFLSFSFVPRCVGPDASVQSVQ